MQKREKVEFVPVFVDTIPQTLEENKIYISERFETSSHLCACGCGEKAVLPLGNRGWTLTKHENGKISFNPSVGNWKWEAPNYHAHYYITENMAIFV